MINASACWSSLRAPGRPRYKFKAPKRAAPTRTGNPNTARAPSDRRRGERWPPEQRRVSQIRFQGHRSIAVGVNTRPLAQRVLQVLDQRRSGIRRTQRRLRHIPRQQHDPRPVHSRHLGRHRAQPARPIRGAPLGQQGQDPNQPGGGHLAHLVVGTSPLERRAHRGRASIGSSPCTQARRSTRTGLGRIWPKHRPASFQRTPILVTETATKATGSADCCGAQRPVSPSGPGIGSTFSGRSRVGVAAKAVPGTCRSRPSATLS